MMKRAHKGYKNKKAQKGFESKYLPSGKFSFIAY